MKFDWTRFFRDHGIEYVDSGPNVKRGWININCPFCGATDTSHHMGINPEGTFWGCWRSKQHRGHSAAKLVARLINVPLARAAILVGELESPELENFDTIADQLRADFAGRKGPGRFASDRPNITQSLRFPADFREFTGQTPALARFVDYLVSSRCFDVADLPKLVANYSLRYAISGDMSDRVIFPYIVDGAVVSWSGRSIYSDAQLRYRDLEVEQSIVPVKECLYNYDNAKSGGEVLLVVEGPFDVLKVDFYGAPYGVRAVGMSTKGVTTTQLVYLQTLVQRYLKSYLVTDNDDWSSSIEADRLATEMSHTLPRDHQIGTVRTPKGIEDPGAMQPTDVRAWSEELIA